MSKAGAAGRGLATYTVGKRGSAQVSSTSVSVQGGAPRAFGDGARQKNHVREDRDLGFELRPDRERSFAIGRCANFVAFTLLSFAIASPASALSSTMSTLSFCRL